MNITGILVLGVAVCLLLWGVDVVVSRWAERRAYVAA